MCLCVACFCWFVCVYCVLSAVFDCLLLIVVALCVFCFLNVFACVVFGLCCCCCCLVLFDVWFGFVLRVGLFVFV